MIRYIEAEELSNRRLGELAENDYAVIGQGVEEWQADIEGLQLTQGQLIVFHPLVEQDDTSLSFDMLLLDERYAQGVLLVPQQVIQECGGINVRLEAGRSYEWLLRLAQRYPVTGRRAMMGMKLQQVESSYKTDCYIFGRYGDHLRQLGYYDEVISQLLNDGRVDMTQESRVELIEHMIKKDAVYRDIEAGTAPILIYYGVTYCYNILNTMLLQLEQALRKRGEQVIAYDEQAKDVTGLAQYIGCRFKAVIGCQSYLFSVYLKQSEQYLHDRIDGPKFNMILDHPIWLIKQLRHVPRDYYVLTHDQNYRDFIDYFCPEVTGTYLFPPAGTAQKEKAEIPWEKRRYDVGFIGTYGDYRGKLQMMKECVPEIRHLASRFLLTMRRAPRMTAEAAFRQTLIDCGMEVGEQEFLRLFYEMRAVTQCIMYYYREQTIRTLVEAQIQVQVWGSTWKESPLADHPYLVIHEDVTPQESLSIMHQTKIALNIMAWHKGGFTERMASSLLAGAVVLTDETTYPIPAVEGQSCLVMFSLEELKKLPQQVKRLLADKEQSERIRQAGYEYATHFHTWDTRAEQLLAMIETLREKESEND